MFGILRLKLRNIILIEFCYIFLWDGLLVTTILSVVEVESGWAGIRLLGIVLRQQNLVNTLHFPLPTKGDSKALFRSHYFIYMSDIYQCQTVPEIFDQQQIFVHWVIAFLAEAALWMQIAAVQDVVVSVSDLAISYIQHQPQVFKLQQVGLAAMEDCNVLHQHVRVLHLVKFCLVTSYSVRFILSLCQVIFCLYQVLEPESTAYQSIRHSNNYCCSTRYSIRYHLYQQKQQGYINRYCMVSAYILLF